MTTYDVAIVGAGFTGLVAALQFSKQGKSVVVLEADDVPGGLASTFTFPDGVEIEKFYHHWFNNDVYVPELVSELGLDGEIVTHPSATGMYLNGRLWNLSSPIDLLRFTPLSFLDRIRLGLLVFRVRGVQDWKKIEHLTVREWLEPLCGKKVFETIWLPLLQSKFSVYEEKVGAVWMWKKLVLRGSTRNKTGGEELAYFRGGFGKLAEAIANEIVQHGGSIQYNTKITNVIANGTKIEELMTDSGGSFSARQFLFTPSFPVIADILEDVANPGWIQKLRRVNYLGNICLALRLNKSLSDTYWINVNDPGFPFVGVIEHTNFDPPENYAGSHIAYLSRYLSTEDPVWNYTDEEYIDFAFEHLVKMFPDFERSWIVGTSVWRAEFAQQIAEPNYSAYLPSHETPYENAFISTMAQIYPQDRGTNYAIRDGKNIVKKMQAANR